MEWLKALWEAARPHLSAIVLVLTWVGIALAYFRKRGHWRAKRFSDQVNFSLNFVADGCLQLRTLLETTTSRVWQNDYGIRIVQAAAKKTTADQPFIVLDDPDDMAFVKRAALNVISEAFSPGFLAAAVGLPVRAALFHFAITFENFTDMRTRKFRILMVEARNLVQMFGPGAQEPSLHEPLHADRLRVLQAMAKLAADPNSDRHHILGRIQLTVQC